MEIKELSASYNHKDFEARIYKLWEETGSFKPQSDKEAPAVSKFSSGKTYSIVIPPPNVTGVLHMGHAINNVLQDIIVRYHRMCGDDTLWLTGTDHAGIATQNVVERQLKKEGLTKASIGREAFLARTWQVKKTHHDIITRQQRALGNSTDWTRECFTMDDKLSQAVRRVFVSLYERNLIYKGQYLVNWCTRCGTALSDDEVVHTDIKGKMYYIYYKFAPDSNGNIPHLNGKDYVEIATTRPETLLGDVAVAVNPCDTRYKEIVGKSLYLPLTNKVIPIIEDLYVDKEFGTGMVKITPAHDVNDYAVGQRHKLEAINILTKDGKLNENCPKKYQGLTTGEARKVVIEDLKEQGLYKEEKEITHSVGTCYRCNTVIEPYLSTQWFVKMQPLAKKALKAWQEGQVKFYPKKWENTYKHWLENIRDWCISRQLWWGHRIPAWQCSKCGNLIVRKEEPETCPECHAGKESLIQDPDVLDTWFSSWLWPFSTLGWPNKTEDYKRFYPTSTLVTAYDIIFFWVSRMIMAGLEFTGEVPFSAIYIHGLVRDMQGRKMSKSLGNGMDPLDIIDTYGSDALKWTVEFLCAQGQDIYINKDSFKMGSRFCNKVWNACRYLLGNLSKCEVVKVTDRGLTLWDKWIYYELNIAIKNTRAALEEYRYNDAASALMQFFWGQLCDWYIEKTKINFRDGSLAECNRCATILLNLLEETLRLLHPFIPFVTEEIYSCLPITSINALREGEGIEEDISTILPTVKYQGLLINAPYPIVKEVRGNTEAKRAVEKVKEVITLSRALKLDSGIAASAKVDIAIYIKEEAKLNLRSLLSDNIEEIKMLAGVKSISFVDKEIEKGAIGAIGEGYEVFVMVGEGADKEAILSHFNKEIEKEKANIERSNKKLSPAFLAHAPKEVVEEEGRRVEEAKKRISILNTYISHL